jgi:putative ABC transport system permease protein
VFVAAVVFGASLSAVLSTPAAYGWPWDVAVMGGAGYGDLHPDAIRDALTRRDDLASWTMLGLTNDVTVDDEPVMSVFGSDLRAGVDVAVVDGRLPQAPDEVALGTHTASERGVGVGDEVTLGGLVSPHRATVTGLAVLPPLGPFEADRADPGTGMVLPASALDPTVASSLYTFVGMDLAPGADAGAILADLRDVVGSTNGTAPMDHREPVRPAEIVNVRSMRAAPLLVGGLLAGSAVVGLAVAILVSVRARRRELAILRALGFTGRQVRTSVRVQAVATIVAALAVGLPLGSAAGRVAWRAFAFRLGVAADPAVPVRWIVATVAGSLVLAVAIALVPARLAARVNPAAALRAE